MHYFHAVATANQDRPVFQQPEVVSDLFRGFQAVTEKGVAVAAYAVQSAHLHVLIAVDDPAVIGEMMKRILGPMAQGLNRRMQQSGGVFQRGFWRAPVASDAYLWQLPLYIHANVNPRAQDAAGLSVGLRSSHAAYVSGDREAWLNPGLALEQYGGNYVDAMNELLEARAKRRSTRPADALDTESPEEQVLLAVARATHTHPSTISAIERGGKRDRMLLAWALARELGTAKASRWLHVSWATADRWAKEAGANVDLQPARRALGES